VHDAELADVLRPALRPGTRLHTRRVAGGEIALGATRIGGRPDLPSSIEWPRWEGFEAPARSPSDPIGLPRGYTPAPLSFLAQLDLADTPDATGLLPEHGWLCFFYDAEQQPWGYDPRDRGCASVVYFEGEPSSLARRDAPPGARVFPAMACEPEVVATLPSSSRRLGVDLENAERVRYCDLIDELSAGKVVDHRLLGWPKEIQNEMELECELVTNGIYCGDPAGYQSAEAKRLEPNARDWVMLFQIDSDEMRAELMWGDSGCVYFWIRQQDLAARRFERCWAILQCG